MGPLVVAPRGTSASLARSAWLEREFSLVDTPSGKPPPTEVSGLYDNPRSIATRMPV